MVAVVLPDATVVDLVVEGGHVTLRTLEADWGAYDVLISQIEREAPGQPLEVVRVPCGDDPDRAYIVFQAASDEAYASVSAACVGPVLALEAPTTTEAATFRCALEAAAEAGGRGETAVLRLLIGDLGLPPELRREMSWMVPARYRSLMRRHGVQQIMIALESRSRNAASRRIREPAKRLLADADVYSDWYAKRGGGLKRIRAGKTAALYLLADVLVTRDIAPYPAIALTGQGPHPSCASIFAAGLMALADRGARRYTGFFDFEDDPRIGAKLIEGVVIAAHFAPDAQISCDIRVLRGGEPFDNWDLDLSELRQAGHWKTFEALLARVTDVMGGYNTDWMRLTEASCEAASQAEDPGS